MRLPDRVWPEWARQSGGGVLRRTVEILSLQFSGFSEARQFILGSALGAAVLMSSFGGVTEATLGELRSEQTSPTTSAPLVPVEPRVTPEPVPSAAKSQLLDSGRTTVPYISQFDGTPWEGSNCGIASIAMVLSGFDITLPTLQVRKSIIGMTGDPSYDAGVAWDPLVKMAWRHNFPVNGPLTPEGDTYRKWFLEELDAESRMGRPSILLVHYRSLPGHENAGWWGDHYVVFLGLTADGDVIYHDPAFRDSKGAYKVTDRATFERAWTNTMSGQQRTAIVVGW